MKKTTMLGLMMALIVACALPKKVVAQDFDTYFENNTLRLDYVFSGNAYTQSVSLDKLNRSPGWYGKTRRLAEVPMEGNGQIIVKVRDTGEVIYRNSFSTLFQEWLTFDEARQTSMAFENVFLIPMPKDTVDVTVELYNNRREKTTSMTHTIDPNDILIRHIGERNVTPFSTLQRAKDPERSINVAIVAEGYTEDEMDTYIEAAQEAVEALFAHEPFKSRRQDFHIVAVKSASKESGTSMPSKGLWKDTALGSHFDTFHSDRYLTTLNIKRLHDVLAGVPYEHIIILVNTDEYGGGGILNSYVLSMTRHPQFRPVVVHEFGHSFGGLADEYAYENEPLPMYPHDVEPWEANITTLKDFHGKWESMIEPGTSIPTPENNASTNSVGMYEGAGYSLKGVYRGAIDCRMRTNDNPEFCEVCRSALTKLIDFYTK